jgi:hypothetical protein
LKEVKVKLKPGTVKLNRGAHKEEAFAMKAPKSKFKID